MEHFAIDTNANDAFKWQNVRRSHLIGMSIPESRFKNGDTVYGKMGRKGTIVGGPIDECDPIWEVIWADEPEVTRFIQESHLISLEQKVVNNLCS